VLVNANAAARQPIDGHLADLAGEHVFCSEFKYRKGIEIFGEGEDAEYVYQITSGAVRTYRMLPDGRRQINAFHLQGDMFGFENGVAHRFSADALVETQVRIIKRSSILDAMQNRVVSNKNLICFVTQNLQHAEDHMLLLGRKSSLERVATFLLEMDERLAHPSMMLLPMNRRDIADYLGLTLETVSRSFSKLKDMHVIALVGSDSVAISA